MCLCACGASFSGIPTTACAWQNKQGNRMWSSLLSTWGHVLMHTHTTERPPPFPGQPRHVEIPLPRSKPV